MRRRSIAGPLLVVAVLAATLLPAAPGLAQEASPSVAVSATEGLADGQVVTVSLSGFPSEVYVSAAICAASDDLGSCGAGFASTWLDAAGSGRVTLTVDALVGGAGTDLVDCRAADAACAVRVTSYVEGEPSTIRVPVSFDPSGPLRPPGTVTVEPATGLVDEQEVQVTATGTGGPSVLVRQCGSGATDASRCATRQQWLYGSLDDPDVLRGSLVLQALLPLDDGSVVDCRTGAGTCALVAGAIGDPRSPAPVALAFDPDAPLAAPPVVEVEPDADLLDGQRVEVGLRGFAPFDQLELVLCGPGPERALDPRTCDLRTSVDEEAGEDGSATLAYTVRAVLQPADGAPIDCRTTIDPCRLVVGGELRWASAPLHLDPAGPLRPPPELAVEPSEGLIDGQVVAVRGSGFPPGAEVAIGQCALPADEPCGYANRAYVAVDAAGDLAVEIELRAVLHEVTTVDCRAEGACDIRVVDDPEVAVGLSFDPDAPLLPPPSFDASPTSDLADGDLVTVTATNLRRSDFATLEQCLVADPGTCGAPTYLEGAGREPSSGSIPVFAVFDRWEGPVDCRAEPGGCALVVTSGSGDGGVAFPLSFGPPPPPRGRYLDRAFEVEVDRDVVYRTATDHLGRQVELRLDLYRPAGDAATDRPAVVWMHGGYFRSGDKSSMEPYARDLASRGYVTASIQYRLRPDPDELATAIVDAEEDADAAVAWLRDHADAYGIDERAIAFGGYSAGAVTAHNVAYGPAAAAGEPSPVAAAVSIAGVRTMGVPEAGEPPLLAFHGSEDPVVPYGLGADSCAQVRAAGVVCELVTWEGGGHEIRSNREVTDRTADFLAEQVLRPLGIVADPPVADAGGPYTVEEGSVVALDGTGSERATTYAWSPADRLDDPTSATPTYAAVDDREEALTLTATGPGGAAADEAVVTVRNAAPVVDADTVAVGPGPERDGLTRRVEASFTDAGVADTHEAQVDWGDGTTSAATIAAGSDGGATLAGQHRYGRRGTYEVRIAVTDDDGGVGEWSGRVEVGRRPPPPPPDPLVEALRALLELLRRLLR